MMKNYNAKNYKDNLFVSDAACSGCSVRIKIDEKQ